MAPVENELSAVIELRRQLAQALILIDKLERENAALRSRVAELEEKLKTDSSNSSQPPSSDQPSKPKKKRKKKGKRRNATRGMPAKLAA